MQRYDLEDARVHGEPWRVMIAHPDGEWVRYEDAAAEIERLTRSADASARELARQARDIRREMWSATSTAVTSRGRPGAASSASMSFSSRARRKR